MKIMFNTDFAPPDGTISRIRNYEDDGFSIVLRFATSKYIPNNVLGILKNETNLNEIIKYQFTSYIKEFRFEIEENIQSIKIVNSYFSREKLSAIQLVSGFNEHKENFIAAKWEITVPNANTESLLEALKIIEFT